MKRFRAFARGRPRGRSASRERHSSGYASDEHHRRRLRKGNKTEPAETKSHSSKHKSRSKPSKIASESRHLMGLNHGQQYMPTAFGPQEAGYTIYPTPVAVVYSTPVPASYLAQSMPGAPLPKPSTHSERSMNNDGLNHPQSPGSLAGQLEGPPAGDRLIVYRCIDCGKARSIDFHLAHPVRLGEEPNANCCKVCLQRRLSGALQSCPIHGNNLFRPRDKGRYRRHFCAACGVVRSSSYHDTHPIEKDEIPPESYCSGCRSMAVENSGGERTQEPPAKENSTSSESESPTRVRSSTQASSTYQRFQARVETDDEEEHNDAQRHALRRCKNFRREMPASTRVAADGHGSRADLSDSNSSGSLSPMGTSDSYRVKPFSEDPDGLPLFIKGKSIASTVEERSAHPSKRAISGLSQNVQKYHERDAGGPKGSTTDSIKGLVNDPADPNHHPSSYTGRRNSGKNDAPVCCHLCHQYAHGCCQHPPLCHVHHHHHCYHNCSHHEGTAPCARPRADSSLSSSTQSSSKLKRVQFASPEVSSSSSAVEDYDRSPLPPNYNASEEDDYYPHNSNQRNTSSSNNNPPSPFYYPDTASGSGHRVHPSPISPAVGSTAEPQQAAPTYGFSGIPPVSAFDDIPAHMLHPEQIENLFRVPDTHSTFGPGRPVRHQTSYGRPQSGNRSRPQEPIYPTTSSLPTGQDVRHPGLFDMYDKNDNDYMRQAHSYNPPQSAFECSPENAWSPESPEESKRKAESDARLMAAAAAMNSSFPTSASNQDQEYASQHAATDSTAASSPSTPTEYTSEGVGYDNLRSSYSYRHEGGMFGACRGNPQEYYEAELVSEGVSVEPDCSTSESLWAHPCGPLCSHLCSNHGQLRDREIYEVDSDEEMEIEDARAAYLHGGPSTLYRTARWRGRFFRDTNKKENSGESEVSPVKGPFSSTKENQGTTESRTKTLSIKTGSITSDGQNVGGVLNLASSKPANLALQPVSPAKTDASVYYTATEGSNATGE